jgi:hypothetical protein
MAGGGVASVFAGMPETTTAKTVESWAQALSADGSTIKALSITTDASGKSSIAETDVGPDKSPYPLFKQFFTHKADKVAIFRAPPGHYFIDEKKAKALLLIVDGEIELTTDAGPRKTGRGSFVLFDGKGANTQRAGRAGYTAIKVLLAD